MMDTASPTGDGALSMTMIEQIERECDRFEAARKAGQRPRIEDYLGNSPEPVRPALQRELILLDLEYRRRSGDDPRHPGAQDREQSSHEVAPSGPGAPLPGQSQGAPAPVTPAQAALLETSTYIRGDRPAPGAAAPDGSFIAGYEILGELGQGGMGVVYKARHQGLNRLVALKMIRAGTQARPEELARFRIEAEAVAQLRHPNVVQIYDIGEVASAPFFSLELLEGGSLSHRLAGTPQPGRPAAALIVTLARAMHAAHQAGIVHRDLKPANVLFDRDGTPKIADFGLAKRLERADGQTQTGQVMGTPSYMAPEQARGRPGEIDALADVYALGAILYELLTGRPPFKAPTPLETVRQVVEEEPVPPSRLQSRVSRDLETICLKCLAKEPHRRYASAAALADDLGRFLAGEPIRARRTPPWERGLKWARRRPVAATLLALSVTSAVGLVGAGLWYDDYEDDRVAALRLESVEALFKGRDALAREDWNEGGKILSRLFARIEAEPRLADLRARASDMLERINRGLTDEQSREADRARHLTFGRRRDEALIHDTQFTGLDLPSGVEATRTTARTALGVFAAEGRDEAWELSPLPASLSPQERDDVISGCYVLLLVLAEAVAQPLADEDPRQQADLGLRILDRAAGLRPPTRAYHLRRAACLARRGDAEGAERERHEAERLPPANAFDHFLSGQERYKHRDWTAAIHHFDAALRLQPDYFWAQCLSAICSLQMQRPTKARTGLTACLQRRPDSPWLYLLRGHAYGVEGQLELALAKLLPAEAARHEAEAMAHFEDAEADFRTVLELQPNDNDRYVLLVNRGTMRLLRRRFDDTLADLREAIQLRPCYFLAYATLAQAYQQQGRPEEAVEQFTRAIDLRSDWAPLYRSRADLHLERGDRSRALRDLEEAIRREAPESPLVARDHTRQGQLLYLDGHYDEALDACHAALKIVPDHAEAHLLRVRALLELKRYEDVIGSCDTALARGRPSADLYELRGLARVGRDDFAGAIEDYTQALALQPNSARVHAYRGWAHLFAAAPRLALRDFEEAVRLDPQNSDAYNGRGSARVQLGRHREAVADANAALRHGERTARVLYNAARTYAQAAAVEMGRPGRSDLAVCSRYQEYAQALLRQALERLPAAERASFWRDVVQKDSALLLLRRRPKFVSLAAQYARPAE